MKDLIYRHELRKELSKVHAEMGLCSKKEVMDIIGRQPKANTDNNGYPDWIKTTDRPPEYGQKVIIHMKNMSFCDCAIFDGCDQWYDGTITHWMPMPSAPASNQ